MYLVIKVIHKVYVHKKEDISGKELLPAAEACAFEIRNVQYSIAVKFGRESFDGHSKQLNVDESIDGKVEYQYRCENQYNQKSQPRGKRSFFSWIKEIVLRRGSSEVRSVARRKGIIACAALVGTSVHRQASLTK